MTSQLSTTVKLFNKNKQRASPPSIANNTKTNCYEKGVKANKFGEPDRNSYVLVTVTSTTAVRGQTLTVSDCSKVIKFVI